jgi:uncharacterized protein (DUF58 family)
MRKLFRQSIKVKKTSRFYLVILIMFLLFIAGFVHNNNLAYIVLFFVFSISFIGIILGRLNIKRAKLTLLPVRVFAGEKTKLLFKKEDFIGEIENEVCFKKRGINKIELTLKSDYPFKMAVFYKKIPFEVLVYPELKGDSLKKSFSLNDDFDFEGLKKYENESIKYIHWPSLAKGNLYSKLFFSQNEDERLIFDYSEIRGDKETKISQIAKWAKEAFERNLEFEIILPGRKIYSKEGFDEVFKKLALY